MKKALAEEVTLQRGLFTVSRILKIKLSFLKKGKHRRPKINRYVQTSASHSAGKQIVQHNPCSAV